MRSAIAERKQRLFHDKSVAEAFQVAVETMCRQRPAGVLPLAMAA